MSFLSSIILFLSLSVIIFFTDDVLVVLVPGRKSFFVSVFEPQTTSSFSSFLSQPPSMLRPSLLLCVTAVVAMVMVASVVESVLSCKKKQQKIADTGTCNGNGEWPRLIKLH